MKIFEFKIFKDEKDFFKNDDPFIMKSFAYGDWFLSDIETHAVVRINSYDNIRYTILTPHRIGNGPILIGFMKNRKNFFDISYYEGKGKPFTLQNKNGKDLAFFFIKRLDLPSPVIWWFDKLGPDRFVESTNIFPSTKDLSVWSGKIHNHRQIYIGESPHINEEKGLYMICTFYYPLKCNSDAKKSIAKDFNFIISKNLEQISPMYIFMNVNGKILKSSLSSDSKIEDISFDEMMNIVNNSKTLIAGSF